MNKIKVLILKTKKEAISHATKIIERQIKSKPSSVLGLATGRTMIPLYKSLSSKKINFSKTTVFNLDEYITKNERGPFRKFMDDNLFNKIDINKINFLNSNPKNIKRECARYESLLSKSKKDLQILGIGRNGHIAFNEPGSSFKSKTRKVKLSAQTKKINKSPPFALTVGIQTILQAKKIILLAFGKHKANAIAKALRGKQTTKAPASALQTHRDVTFIIDEAAASQLREI